MKFPVFTLLAGNLAFSETSSQLTPPSSGESGANLTSSIMLGYAGFVLGAELEKCCCSCGDQESSVRRTMALRHISARRRGIPHESGHWWGGGRCSAAFTPENFFSKARGHGRPRQRAGDYRSVRGPRCHERRRCRPRVRSDARCGPKMPTDPEAPPIRPERHIPNSIATMRRRLIVALARTLPRCPCCNAPIRKTARIPDY
jgi:hypothetical protein